MRLFGRVLTAALVLLASGRAAALDKQGAAHAGGAGEGLGQSLSGALFLGVMPVNPSYAARPDNSGLAGLRAGGHVDVNVIGARLFAPLDVNMFTDRCVNWFRPSELDLIGGIASAWPLARGQLEIGARVEQDRGIDGDVRLRTCNPGTAVGNVQFYGDLRARYAFSLGEWWPGLRDALADGDVTGWATLGWFAVNPTTGSGPNLRASYYARPENSGVAFLRYVAHASVSTWHKRLALVVDLNFFTDRVAPNPVRPSELDLTIEVVGSWQPWELHFGYERDMPVDQGGFNSGFVQQMLMASVSWSFDVSWANPKPPGMQARRGR